MTTLREAAQQALEALEAQHKDRTAYSEAKRRANATCGEFKNSTLSALIESGYMHVMGKQTVEAITALKAALVEDALDRMSEDERKLGIQIQPVQEPIECEPQYANEDGWCDWVCPKPQGYLMQCCDCGLIHEVESRVAKYEPLPSEVFEVVDDPDLQVQWRMKRRDDISPKQPVQEPVGHVYRYGKDSHGREWHGIHWYDPNLDVPTGTKLYTTPPQRKENNDE